MLPSSPSSPSPCEIPTAMAVTLSPSSYITPFIFGFLKSIDLQSVGLRIDSVAHLLPFVNPSHTTIGKENEIVVHESFMTESREVADESLSTDHFLGCENVFLNILRNLFLMITPLVTLMLTIVIIVNLLCGSNELCPQ